MVDAQSPASNAMTLGRRGLERTQQIKPRTEADREEMLFLECMQEFAQMQLQRNTFGGHWEEVAELIYPTYRNTFFYGNFNWQGEKKTHRQIDASGMVALSRFTAICDSLLTPRNMIWQELHPDDEYLEKSRRVRLYFETVTKLLFKYRYAARANFAANNHQNFSMLGAFGNHCMFIDEFDMRLGGGPGLRYKSIPIGEMFFGENHQGQVNRFIRWFKLTAQQAFEKFGAAGFPTSLQPALEANSSTLYNFLHQVKPRTDYDPLRLDHFGKPYASYYFSIEGRVLCEEAGYSSFPTAIGRYEQGPNEIYGRGPAMNVLPALKTLNAEKGTFLTQGHRAAAPPLLTHDDGLINPNVRPNSINAGGMNADGKPLIGILPTGQIQTTEEMMKEEKSLINDVFLVTLFQILEETPQMTATEVIERTNEKGILLAPTMGRQDSEYLGPMTDRELDVLANLRLLPPMPPELLEARGKYKVVYTSPLARAARAQESAGWMRTVEMAKEMVAVTQDMSILDPFAFDRAIPAIARNQSVPESWMATDDEIKKKQQARAQQSERQMQAQEAGGKAALMKAQAVAQAAQQSAPPGRGIGRNPGVTPQAQPQQQPGA